MDSYLSIKVTLNALKECHGFIFLMSLICLIVVLVLILEEYFHLPMNSLQWKDDIIACLLHYYLRDA